MAKEMKMNKILVTILIALMIVLTVYILNTSPAEPYTEENIKISELISASIDLARRGGRRIVQVRNMDDSKIGQLSKGKTKEGKDEYVTIGDKVRPICV